MASRDKAVAGFRKSLDPLRLTLRTQPFLGGAAANYADYIVFGAFQWARVVSPFKLLDEDDPVYAWRERLLDALTASRGSRRDITGRAPISGRGEPSQALSQPEW